MGSFNFFLVSQPCHLTDGRATGNTRRDDKAGLSGESSDWQCLSADANRTNSPGIGPDSAGFPSGKCLSTHSCLQQSSVSTDKVGASTAQGEPSSGFAGLAGLGAFSSWSPR